MEENVTLTKAQHNELMASLEKEKTDKANLVSEIKELREKKQLTEAEVETLKQKVGHLETLKDSDATLTPEKVAEIAARTFQENLSKKDNEDAKLNREAALNQFKSEHKEFHDDNDVGGIRFSALEKELSKFNVTGLKSKEQFYSIFESARKLMDNTIIKEEKREIVDHTPIIPSTPKEVEEASKNLSKDERGVIDRSFKGDTKKYLEMKAKRPEFVARLFALAQ